MANNELLIKINADAANASKAFDDIKGKTEDLEGVLNKVALISAAAFAAFTAEIYSSVHAFEDAEKSSVQLTNALQNQGIYTTGLKKDYEDYAAAVQKNTGIDDDAIKKAQAVAQSLLGQTKISEKLTEAIADLGAYMGGDLNGAAEKIARTIGTGTNAFAKQGLVIAQGATEAERYAKVLAFVQAKAGGLAAEMNKADGYSQALSTSFGNLQEEIGKRFEPVVAGARKALASFFQTIKENPVIVDIIASLITAGVVVSGLIATIAALTPVFFALTAAVEAFGIASNVAFAGIPLAIGLIVAAVTYMALNWDKSMAFLTATAKATITFLSDIFSGFGKVLQGAFEFDPDKIDSGLTQLKDAFKNAKDEGVATYEAITLSQQVEAEKQSVTKAKLAAVAENKKREHQARLVAIEKASIDLIRLQNENASAETIALKGREIETIKALDQEVTGAQKAALRERLAIISNLQKEQRSQDGTREIEFLLLQQQVKLDLQNQGIAAESSIANQRLAELRAQQFTELDADRALQEELITNKQEANKQRLLDTKKYGETYATINQALHSKEVQGAATAANELVALQQSKNATLKEIGKAAAITQISISTAESATKAFDSLYPIPFVGPILAGLAAAAVVAFGAERIGQVTSAADGGLITGGIPGKDSVPALLMPGELVVPAKNFDQVVGAVQGQGPAANDPEVANLLRSIDSKFSNPQVTHIQGDVLTDDSYIDALVRKISDALEFRNAKIVGVNI